MNESNKMLYLFGYSINNYKQFNKLVKIIRYQSESGVNISFVFMHDAVIGLSKNSKINNDLNKLLGLNISFFALLPDLKARGIKPKFINDNIKSINYEGLVDLLVANSRIISWL